MKEQFVTYQLSLKLKELGFNEQCFAGYKEYVKDNIMLMMPSNKPFLNIDDFGYKEYSYQNKHVTKAPLWQQAFDYIFKKLGDHSITFFSNGSGYVSINDSNGYIFDFENKKGALIKLIEILENENTSS